LGPADWTHGIARPVQNAVADPNTNLTVQLFRQPKGAWVGGRAETRWRPAAAERTPAKKSLVGAFLRLYARVIGVNRIQVNVT
jgi:hypothetical protein